MAGLYVHIPFCKKRCLYCDFFSTTLLDRREEYVGALLREIEERRDEAGEPIRTIYIGGGTPSTLTVNDIQRILDAIGTEAAEEITMEVNPGDLSLEYLSALRQTGVNRLSIGIQSFKDHLLERLGRRHNALQAVDAVRMAQKAGFDNISIDLMYALPGQTMAMWEADIEIALRLGVQHISSYGLMYEPGTPFTSMRDNGELKPVSEITELKMYDYLCKRIRKDGYALYEISNFAQPGFEAKHNSSYWNGTQYIGVGAGAHSYLIHEDENGPTQHVRSWNPDNLDAYIRCIQSGTLQRESETLSRIDLYNEKIMLGLRTMTGIPLDLFDPNRTEDGLEPLPVHPEVVLAYRRAKLLRVRPDKTIVASKKGRHVLNRIIEDLMI